MKHKYGCSFRCNIIGLEKDEVMQLLKLVLENCVFTFQDKFFKQLHGTAMGSPCSPVVANIYVTCCGLSVPAHRLRDLGELCLPPKGAVLSLTLLLVQCLLITTRL